MKIFLGIIIPFIGTVIGASMVFFMKEGLNKKVEKLLSLQKTIVNVII